MTANATDFGSAALGALLRAVGLVALAIGAALALIFAFFAAMVVGLMIAGAALAMKNWPARRRTERSAPGVLEARRTPSGWVVETSATRKS
jgi:membrane protein implicated in regulation of membrane protease activity